MTGPLHPASPRTVLVVDDEPDIGFALSVFLTRLGWRVLTASDGVMALAVLEQHGLPDVVMLDMKMPVMDGWQFVRELRARHARIPPLVVMTAAAAPAQRARDVGAVAVVEKPFLLEDVQRALERALALSTSSSLRHAESPDDRHG
jgi:CheY-like chemotaxis protein